jgi:hypothetical protein
MVEIESIKMSPKNILINILVIIITIVVVLILAFEIYKLIVLLMHVGIGTNYTFEFII